MSSAPVCFINPPPPAAEPVTNTIPAIPVATDLQSAIQAVNTLRQIIQDMTNQNPQPGRITDLVVNSKKAANFVEVVGSRKTQMVKVTDPNDSSTYIVTKQITGLTFHNPVTKQNITWKQ